MPAKAVVLAAGMGSRLCPLTPFVPKEMLPVGGFPAIHHVLSELVAAGVKDVAVVLSEGKEMIRDYLTAQLDPKGEDACLLSKQRERVLAALNVTFLTQKVLLGTAHAVYLARDFAKDDPLLVVYPDDLLQIDGHPTCGCARVMIDLSETSGDPVVLAGSVPGDKASQYGVLDIKRHGDRHYVTAIREKPKDYAGCTARLMIGRMVLPPRVVDGITKHRFCDAEGIVPTLAKEASDGRLLAVMHRGVRYDVGSHKGYLSLLRHMLLKNNKEALYGERTLPNMPS